MKVLVAEDGAVARRLLESLLAGWGYDPVSATDGDEAWSLLRADPALRLSVLDWEMPGLDGIELCRRLRWGILGRRVYVLLCTARDHVDHIVEGLDAGADDYVTKPIRPAELHARVRVGARTLKLEQSLRDRIHELREAVAHVQQLQGLLPICMHCKSVRNDRNVWQRIEDYIEDHADVSFSHGLCEACLKKHYPSPEKQQPA